MMASVGVSFAKASASPSTSRPSASVSLTSTVRPLREVRMSFGFNALPEITFSTAATRTRSRIGRQSCMIICASPITVAAPPMSFFISNMPFEGLIFSPPVSKQTPLQTSVRCGPVLPQFISNRRGASNGMDHREILRQKVITAHHLCSRTKTGGQRQESILQLGRAKIGSGGVDQIAGQEFPFGHCQKAGGINACGGFQQGGFGRGFPGAVAVKSIGRQQPRQGGFTALFG